MLMGLKKSKFSHKLKNIKIIPKTFEPDLNKLQTKIGIQSRFVETLAVNSSISAEVVRLAANSSSSLLGGLNVTVKNDG
jgi:hypothetical protein